MIPADIDMGRILSDRADSDVSDGLPGDRSDSHPAHGTEGTDRGDAGVDTATWHDAVTAADRSGVGPLKVVVLDDTSASGPDLRDVAQTVKDDTGATTVVVQTPGNAAAVSSALTRSQIEKNEHLLAGTTSPSAATDFLVAADHSATPTGTVTALTVVGALVAAAVAAAATAFTGRATARVRPATA